MASSTDRNQHFLEIRKRFESVLKSAQSIVYSGNPLADQLGENHTPQMIADTFNLYMKFEGMRSSTRNEAKIQALFEKFLEKSEFVVEQIRKVSASIAGDEHIDESSLKEIAKIILGQVEKFKKNIKGILGELEDLNTEIKDQLSLVEHQIRFEIEKTIRRA